MDALPTCVVMDVRLRPHGYAWLLLGVTETFQLSRKSSCAKAQPALWSLQHAGYLLLLA